MSELTMNLVACSVPWCVGLCPPESTKCAVHRHGDVHPEPLAKGEQFTFVPFIGNRAQPIGEICDSCEGTGECQTCEGEGTHTCSECSDEHECGTCDGSGECPDCDGAPAIAEIETPPDRWGRRKPQPLLAPEWVGDRDWAVRYLRAIYIPAYREVAMHKRQRTA